MVRELMLVALGLATLHAQEAAIGRPMRLVWQDEFELPAGTGPDHTKWAFDLGQNRGWGNAELEEYTASTANAFHDGEGHLIIQAIALPGGKYTSARLKTQGLASFRYGRIEARIKVPFGQGIWPAFWMLGSDIATAGWPRCGEIDIMENIGKEPATVHGTVHGPGYSGGSGIGSPYVLREGRFADDFHVFTLDWQPDSIAISVDHVVYRRVTPADLPKGAAWVYDHPFFLLLNLAVGGNWPGYPDSTTQFPQRMTVDYVRVYSRTPGSGTPDRYPEELR
ncbi:MAG TPA: glycoside hydrolase family 16 protein [Candidatus Acidoferrum sp.]|nr:glycoside hydrolase family 16 protein [Candidatus Acidoferrum sp.]